MKTLFQTDVRQARPVLCYLRVPDAKEMRFACRRLRELGAKPLFTFGSIAVVASANERAIIDARRSSTFTAVYRSHIGKATISQLKPELQAVATRWNRLQPHPPVERRKASRSKVSWGNKQSPAVTGLTSLDKRSFEKWLARGVDRLKGKQQITAQKKMRQAMEEGFKGKHSAKAVAKLELRLREQFKDSTFAYNAARNAAWVHPLLWEVMLELPINYIAELFLELPCWKLEGSNVVGIVFVENEALSIAPFSDEQKGDIENEIIAGLGNHLAVPAPEAAQLMFTYERFDVTINEADPGDDLHYFLGSAMGQIEYLGNSYSSDRTGLGDLRRDMGEAYLASHSMVIFVTRDGHPYAGQAVKGYFDNDTIYHSPFIHLAMEPWYSDPNIGLNFISGVAIHEVLHLFGAKDEYSVAVSEEGTPCVGCDGEFGCYELPNGNCEDCARPPRPCIMRQADTSINLYTEGLKLCAYTQGQIGWADLFVELETDDENGSGSQDRISLDIGERVFDLRNSFFVDDPVGRQQDQVDGYALNYVGVDKEDVKRVMLRKQEGTDDYKPERIKVWARGNLVCETTFDTWMDDENPVLIGPDCGSSADLVDLFKIYVTTADEWLAGTDDDVTICLGGRCYHLDNPSINDFEQGFTNEFTITPQSGLYLPMVDRVRIEKSIDGFFGGWKLAGLTIEAFTEGFPDGKVIYSNPSINIWIEDENTLEWEDVIS